MFARAIAQRKRSIGQRSCWSYTPSLYSEEDRTHARINKSTPSERHFFSGLWFGGNSGRKELTDGKTAPSESSKMALDGRRKGCCNCPPCISPNHRVMVLPRTQTTSHLAPSSAETDAAHLWARSIDSSYTAVSPYSAVHTASGQWLCELYFSAYHSLALRVKARTCTTSSRSMVSVCSGKIKRRLRHCSSLRRWS